MQEDELAALVEALTPCVVDACRQQLAPSDNNPRVRTGQTESTSLSCSRPQLPQGPLTTSRMPSSSGIYGQPNRARAIQSSLQDLPSSSRPGRFSSNMPSTSGINYDRAHRPTPREELRNAFRRKAPYAKRQKEEVYGSKSIDVVLLPNPEWSSIVRGKARAKLHEEGLLIDKFVFKKSWSEQQVFDALYGAFEEKLTTENGEPITFCIKKPEGSTLMQPRLCGNDALTGRKMCEIFSQKTVYLCPDRDLNISTGEGHSSDGEMEQHTKKGDIFSTKADHGEDSNSKEVADTADEFLELLDVDDDEVFTCPRCTFINPGGATVCGMCFGDDSCELDPTISSASTSSNSTGVQKTPSGLKKDDAVQQIRDILNFQNNSRQHIHVCRKTVFEDNIGFFKKSFKVESPISVRFQGEMAIDAGGPLRENFRLLVHKLHSSELNIFFGTHSHNLLPSNNQMLLYSGMFEVLGKIIAAAIINDAPINIPLHPAVIACIFQQPREDIFSHLKLDDILDLDLQQLLREILDCKTDDDITKLVTSECSSLHWLDSCGWPVSKKITASCKHELVLCVMHHYIIGVRSASISAIQKGLKCGDKFPLNFLTPQTMMALLTPNPVSKAQLLKLAEKSLQKLESEKSDAANFVVRLIRELDESEASKVAIFATGTDKLFNDLDEIQFELNKHNRQETSPIGNTCTCTVLFPTSYSDFEKFRTHMLKMMSEAVDFFGML